MPPYPRLPLAALLGVALALAACGGRRVPATFPSSSASSTAAPEAPVGDPTVALTSDPPLPGEPVGAWTGLADDAGAPQDTGPAAPPMHHHAH